MAELFEIEFGCLRCKKWHDYALDAKGCCSSYDVRYKCEKCGNLFSPDNQDDADEMAKQCCVETGE